MSWDIFVQDIPPSIRSVEDMPDEFTPAAIGRRRERIGRILEVVPFADFSNPARGRIDSSDFSIEVSMGDDDPVFCFAFHIRGGDMAAAAITDILLHLGLRAFDPTAPSGIFNVGDSPDVGLRRWSAYRDGVLGKQLKLAVGGHSGMLTDAPRTGPDASQSVACVEGYKLAVAAAVATQGAKWRPVDRMRRVLGTVYLIVGDSKKPPMIAGSSFRSRTPVDTRRDP